MNFLRTHLETFLVAAAIAQCAIALLNLSLVRIMKWERDLACVSLLVREVFHIHCFFISLTLAIFGILTWRFAEDIASAANPLAVWLAVSIGVFWLVRSAMQWLYYSPSHWRGDALRTAIHLLLFFGYAALAAVYFTAAFWRTT